MVDRDPGKALAGRFLVADALQKQVQSGALRNGDRLPSQRHLTQTFGVAEATARAALQLLVMRGVARAVPGQGFYVDVKSAAAELRDLVISDPEVTDLEKSALDLIGPTDAVWLVGRAFLSLRTTLSLAHWVDCWTTSDNFATIEWMNGPSVDAVVEVLVPRRSEDGSFTSGVPGLRRAETGDGQAQLIWLPRPGLSLRLLRQAMLEY